MEKIGKSKGRRKAEGEGQLWFRLPGLVGAALYDTVIGMGLACVERYAYGILLQGLRECLEEDPKGIENFKSGSAKAREELLARIDRKALTPPQKAKSERDLLSAFTRESKR
jgi:hypothetical protein